MTIDTVAPLPPAITDAGGVSNNGATQDTTPTISGTGVSGDTILIYNNGVQIGTATVAGGVWSFTPNTALSEGQHKLTAAEVDAAGNVSPLSPVYTVTVDTIAPTTPLIDDISSSTLANGVLYTNDNTPTLTGTGEPGTRITVSIDGAASTVTTTVQPDGTRAGRRPRRLLIPLMSSPSRPAMRREIPLARRPLT